MKKYMHIPTILEFVPEGFEPPVLEFETTPSTDWVEFPELTYDSELEYIHIDTTTTVPEFSVELKDADAVRATLKTRVTTKYDAVLNGGFQLPDGTPIGSDFEDRGFISAMETKLSIDPTIESIDYKLGSGWITIDRPMALGVYQLMLGHVAACDGKLQALNSQLDNSTTSSQLVEVFNTGIDAGWPTYE